MTKAEKRFDDYLNNRSGSFFRALFEAITKADAYNTGLLKKAYPEEIEVYLKYIRGEGYGKTLKPEDLILGDFL